MADNNLGKSFQPTKVALQQTTSGGTIGGYDKLQPNTSVKYGQDGSITNVSYTGSSPTVMSNASIIEDDIPAMKAQYQGYTTPLSVQANQGEDPLYQQYNIGNSPEDKRMFEIENEMRRTNDKAYQQQLQNIQANFGTLKKEQENANKALEAGQMQALLMSGSARYAPLSSEGIEQAQKSYGIEKLSAITAQENSAMAAATAAYDSRNYAILEKELARLEKVRAERMAVASQIANQQAADLNARSAKMREQNLGLAIGELVNGGITDPYEILSYISEAGGDATPQEVNDMLAMFSLGGNADSVKTDIQLFEYLRKNDRLPAGITSLPESEQYMGFLSMQKMANSGKLGQAAALYGGGGSGGGGIRGVSAGIGAKDPVEESIIRTRLFAKLSTVLNRGALSDSDREIIDARIAQFRNAGLSEQEIMSRLAGFPDDVATPYNQSFIEIAAANTSTLEQQQALMGKLGQLLSTGNYTGAMQAAENQAMKNAKEIDPEGYIGQSTASNVLKKADAVKKKLDEAKKYGVTGPVQGTLQQFFGRFKGKEAAALQAEITSLVATMRKEFSGSAVTPSEAAFLEPLIASLSDKDGNFLEKINALERMTLNQLNATRGSVALPDVSLEQARDAQLRLQLYARAMEDNYWGSDTGGGFVITEGNGYYEIPEE